MARALVVLGVSREDSDRSSSTSSLGGGGTHTSQQLTDFFIVTEKWVHQHATGKGGYTRQQLAILGVSWPPKRGWIKRVTRKRLTLEQKTRFENGRPTLA